MNLPARVRAAVEAARLPAYVYDLTGLRTHVAAIRRALPAGTELYYAVKANPDGEVLRTLVPHVDGFEVSSAGELRHCGRVAPGVPVALSGPGKTHSTLAAAVASGALVHVESERELRTLDEVAGDAGRAVDALLRVNLPTPLSMSPAASSATRLPALLMGGLAAPFGMDLDELRRCGHPRVVRLRGVHAHLASGLDAAAALEVAGRVAAFAGGWCGEHGIGDPLINCGGGMDVNYAAPSTPFDWAAYGRGLSRLPAVRIEPGRSVTAYCGWYVTRVLDVKHSYGQRFAIVSGGTHHLRTPAAKGHSQPCVQLGEPGPGTVTFVGQLCTPKDVLASEVEGVPAIGDIVAFGLAGAYAWNISHHSFLMHPRPSFHYV